MSFSFHPIHTENVHFDSLIKMVSARFLYYKVIGFPFVINEYIVRR